MTKGRLEAFSDGVLAVAITLLVLDLKVDVTKHESLWNQLREEWPSFAAYLVSFFVIGIIWVNHHALFTLLDHVDRTMLFYNLLLLLWVSTIPFTTSTLASYVEDGSTSDIRVAVLLYGISNEGMAIGFFLILRHMLTRPLISGTVLPADRRKALLRFGAGSIVYPVVTVVGLFSPLTMYALYLAVLVYYMVDQTAIVPGIAGDTNSSYSTAGARSASSAASAARVEAEADAEIEAAD
jgi:uncharacterized membrane protein